MLVKEIKGSENTRLPVEKNRVAVIQYLHKISNNLKQVAKRYGVQVVLPNPKKCEKFVLR